MLKKTINLILTAIILASPLVSCSESTNSDIPTGNTETSDTAVTTQTEENEEVSVAPLDITVFDVGKADSMVLRLENSTVVIDCGEKGDGKEIVNLLEENDITTIDYLIITHYDKDHVGGAAKVINNMEVLNVLAPDYEEDSDEMDKYNKALSEHDITPQLLTSDISFTLDNTDFTVYAPKLTDYGEDDDNDFSLVTKVVHGNNTLIFTGDAMEQRLEEIMDIGDCDFLKVPYHGRKLDNLKEFLDAVTPEYAVVCTSSDEFAGSTQKLLIEKNIEYYSTCFNGKIEIESDGESFTFTTEKGT